MNKLLLALLTLLTLYSPALAQLGGTDTKPGDACTAAEEGHVRRNASADRDESEITLMCDGSQWQSATGGGGLASLQGQNDLGPCTAAKDGLIKYNAAGTPRWEYCHGGTTSWLPFRLPQCQNDGAGECTLSALRSADDAQFLPSRIQCGTNILGVTGTFGSGSSSDFNFTDVTNAATSTLTTASAVTVSGIPAGCTGAVSVSGQGTPQISIAGGAWGTSGTISNGQTLAVRLTSASSAATEHQATVTIGSTESVWSVSTVGADTTPNAFTFTDQPNAALSSLITSNNVTISGINVGTSVSVSGTGSPQISINGGAWVTSGTITNGQTLAVRLTSSSTPGAALSATVNVGGVTDNWSVTTTTGPGTVTLVGVRSSESPNVALPTGAQAGDLAFFYDSTGQTSASFDKSGAGWTALLLDPSPNYNHWQALWYKILTAADISAGLVTGYTGGEEKKGLAVFRAANGITSVTVAGYAEQSTAGNPTLQTIDPTGTTASSVILMGWAGSNNGGNTSGTLSSTGTEIGNFTKRRSHFEIQNGSFASRTYDMGDWGNNRLATWYFEIR